MAGNCEKEVISNGFIKTKASKIIDIGQMSCLNEEYMSDPDIIDASSCEVYPGFIDAHTHLGMFTNGESYDYSDANELSDNITPNLRAIDSINSFDISFKEALHSGITSAVVSPGSSNPIAGQITAVKTYGQRIDNMVIKGVVGIKFSLGENPKSTGGYIDDSKKVHTRMGTACLIRETLYKAKLYLKNRNKKDFDYNDYDDKYEALIPLLRGEISAYFHAHRADDIYTALRICKEFKIKCVVVHATESYKIISDLVEEKVDILIGPLISDKCKPELINMNLKSICSLSKSGIKTAITSDHPENPIQYLNIYTALAMASGMSKMDVIRSITINPAQICKIDNTVGSLEVGKDADILIFEQDPFKVGSNPKFVICSGEKICI